MLDGPGRIGSMFVDVRQHGLIDAVRILAGQQATVDLDGGSIGDRVDADATFDGTHAHRRSTTPRMWNRLGRDLSLVALELLNDIAHPINSVHAQVGL